VAGGWGSSGPLNSAELYQAQAYVPLDLLTD
jgi:hypothetical protein